MIVDYVSNLARYKGINPNLDIAIDYLLSGKQATLTDREEINGKAVYAMLQHTTLAPVTERIWENHFEYLDFHVAVEGSEVLGYLNNPDPLEWTDVRRENDIEFSESPAEPLTALIKPGMCAIVWPGEPHKPNTGEGAYTKIVVKVRL